jgi:hypothetical protein
MISDDHAPTCRGVLAVCVLDAGEFEPCCSVPFVYGEIVDPVEMTDSFFAFFRRTCASREQRQMMSGMSLMCKRRPARTHNEHTARDASFPG